MACILVDDQRKRYDITLVLALLFTHKYMSIFYPFLLPLLGLRSGVEPSLRELELVSPYSEKPKVRYVSDFNIGYFT